jgi:ABC-type antimicrobial peptide transport system permease subunit
VLHHFVSGRTREIGIRMALGAEPRRILRFVLGQGLGLTALGLALGGALSLGLVAAIACLLPAHRAAQVDPTRALRSE